MIDLDKTFRVASQGCTLSSDNISRFIKPQCPPRFQEVTCRTGGLDWVPDDGSWWNFQGSYSWVLPIFSHHLQVHQEHTCPPRLQEGTWRTGGVLTGFLMIDLYETWNWKVASQGCSTSSDTISRSVRNLHILKVPSWSLGGHEGSWQTWRCCQKMG